VQPQEGPVALRFGTASTIDLSLTNGGTGTVTSLEATINLPDGVSALVRRGEPGPDLTPALALLASGAAAASCDPSAGSPCALGTLGPGQTAELSIDVEVTEWAEPNPAAAITLLLAGTGMSATSLDYLVSIEASPPRLAAIISPSDIEVPRDGTSTTVPITLENWGKTPASEVRAEVTLPDGVTWADEPARELEDADAWSCVPGGSSGADTVVGEPDVVCAVAEVPGRVGEKPGWLALDLAVRAGPGFESGSVLVDVSAAAPAGPVSTKATLVGVGDAEPELFLDPRADVSLTVVPLQDTVEPIALRVDVALTANVAAPTDAELYVSLPPGLRFDSGAPQQSLVTAGCEAVDPRAADGACAVTVRPKEVARTSFLVRGAPSDVVGWRERGLLGGLQLGVGEHLEDVVVTLRLGQG
ncbi:MAG: hypothetical protein M3Y20_07995, partial [Actinomycetota bacterium]|nr:hypothetical protein [Actinomycetota bacterium]